MEQQLTNDIKTHDYDPWPHRMAVVLCCATFPLIWVGGLVTTYDAGMAVPDWPTTYGYNLFRYPWQTWLFGPFDLFIEHGHRLLGAAVGFLTIAFVALVFWRDRRLWMRFAATGAIAMVIFQGILGGQRVRLDERGLAMIHGCVGLATFAYLAAMAVMTSRFWSEQARQPSSNSTLRLQRLCWLTTAVVYLQIVFGALLRHVPVAAPPSFFRIAVLFHLLFALAVLAHATLTVCRIFKDHRRESVLLWPASTLLGLVWLQLAFGMGTWVLKYGWPNWFADMPFAAAFTVEANSLIQAMVTTAHVAIGALILAASVVLSLRTARFFRSEWVGIFFRSRSRQQVDGLAEKDFRRRQLGTVRGWAT
jgi:cytochrome c oxidase assembly protein subunit 15